MNKEEVKKQYPEIYNSILQEGKEQERLRADALIKMYGSEAIEKIQNGTKLSQKEIALANLKAEETIAKRDKETLDNELGTIKDYE